MTSPVLSRQPLRRLSFRRRPMADPGTTLVFQRANGQLVAPAYPYTTGDIWWRAPRAVFVVDTSPHAESFTCDLPCAGDALRFQAEVGFTWSAHRPEVVVEKKVSDAAGDCRRYLVAAMPAITRKFGPHASEDAENALHAKLFQAPLDLPNGLQITDVSVALRLDPDQLGLARDLEIAPLKQDLAKTEAIGQAEIDKIIQEAELARTERRVSFYSAAFAQGRLGMAGSMLAQDPSKVREAAEFMVSVERQDRDLAIRAMKVLVDSDQLRIGELDPAVQAVVKGFTALVAEVGDRVATGSLDDAPATSAAQVGPADGSLTALEAPDDTDRTDPPAAGDGEPR